MTDKVSLTSSGSVDLRSRLLPIRSQGDRGTCLAFAATAAHETQRLSTTVWPEDLAEEVLYWGCKQFDGNVSPGTSFPSASSALSRWGQPVESFWPYDPERDDSVGIYWPPGEAIKSESCFKGQLLPIPLTPDVIKSHLRIGQAIVLGIQMSHALLDAEEGRIRLPEPQEMIDEGHAVLIVGFFEADIDDDTWLIRNSWGSRWGLDGYGHLPHRYLEEYGGEAWVLI